MSIQNELTKLYKKLSEEGLNKEAQRLTPFIKESQFFTFLKPKHNRALRQINRAIRNDKMDEAKALIDSEDLQDLLKDDALKNDLKSALDQGDRRGFMKTLKSVLKLLKNNKNITFSAVKAEADKPEGSVEQKDSTSTEEKTEDSGSATIKDEKESAGGSTQAKVPENASTETSDSTGKSYDSITENSPVQLTGSYRKYKVKKVTMKDDYIEKIHLTDDTKASYTVNKTDSQFKDIYKQLLDMGYPEDPGEPKSMTSDSTKAYQAKKSKVQNQLIVDLKNKTVIPYLSAAVVGQTVDLTKLLVTDGSYTWALLEDNKTPPDHITSADFERVYFKGYDSKSSRGLGLEVSERNPLPAKNNSAFKILVEKANTQLNLDIPVPLTPENNGPGHKDYVVSNTI